MTGPRPESTPPTGAVASTGHAPPAHPGVAAGPPLAGGRGRQRVLLLGGCLLVAVGVLVLVAVRAGRSDDGPRLDRTQPGSVATVFVHRFATHDPSVCELAEPRLRNRLDRQGRCTGQPGGQPPVLTVLVSKTCGDKHGFDAQVQPPGEVGAPFIAVTLTRVGAEWVVDEVRPVSDGSVLRPYECDTG